MMTELVTTKCEKKKMVAFVDDFSAAEKLKSLLQWWATLFKIGPKFVTSQSPQNHGSSQSLKYLHLEKNIFKYFKVNITNFGKWYLGSVIGTVAYKKKCADEIVQQWISEIKVLS